MARSNWKLWLGLIAAIFIVGMLLQSNFELFSVTNPATLTRTTPSSVNPGQTFTVTYTATDTEKYFVAWSESITGGCTPSTYNDFMASETSGTKSITATFTAPSSGSCTFTGTYQFANEALRTLPSKTITLCTPTCTRPSNLCLTTSADGCGGQCTWVATQNSPGDTNCDNQVSFQELVAYGSLWKSGSVTFQQLITVGGAWKNG